MDQPKDDDILDLTDLGAEPEPKPQASAERPLEVTVPMVGNGACPACGAALRPLEDVCRRCGYDARNPLPKAASPPPPAAPVVPEAVYGVVPVAPGRGRTWKILGIFVVMAAIAISIPLYVMNQPAQRARREYSAGVAAQLRGNFEEAREHYRAALKADPNMGLAAFMMGTTYLHVGDPKLTATTDALVQKATAGDTKDLDEADKYFRQAIKSGEQMEPSRRLMDQKINTPARLKAFARAFLALTALIRAAAAIQADDLDAAMQWLQVVGQEAAGAQSDDPGNDMADRVLKATPPIK